MLSVLTCGNLYTCDDTGYCSKAYDKPYQDQGAAINVAKRQKIVYQMQRMAHNERGYIVLDYADSIEAHSTKWAGLPAGQKCGVARRPGPPPICTGFGGYV